MGTATHSASEPAVRLRAVAFIELGPGQPPAAASSLPAAVAAAGGEVVQVVDRLVLAAFASASDCVRLCRGLEVQVQAGLSCGDVLYEEGLIHGLPVIEASRLKDRAAPGRVLCTQRLQRQTDLPGEAFVALGELELDGFAAPLPACELVVR